MHFLCATKKDFQKQLAKIYLKVQGSISMVLYERSCSLFTGRFKTNNLGKPYNCLSIDFLPIFIDFRRVL